MAKVVDYYFTSALLAAAASRGLHAAAFVTGAASDDAKTGFDALMQEAIDRQIFGARPYIYRDAAFRGQDRLDFLGRGLAK
jgi:2-hydroxychromene-2-carboxylate isomerase